MPAGFFARERELALLRKRLDLVDATREGVALAIRGRRQVGKSRLVQEFCDRANVPYLFWSATKGDSPAVAVADFIRELNASGLGDRDAPQVSPGSWMDAFRALAATLPDAPAIVVIDEIPWLSEQDGSFEGMLQTAWDRLLRPKPVLLVLLGSDMHMMERLTDYDRPFYGRAGNLRLNPLNPAEVAGVLDVSAAEALDAHLITGGLPGSHCEARRVRRFGQVDR